LDSPRSSWKNAGVSKKSEKRRSPEAPKRARNTLRGGDPISLPPIRTTAFRQFSVSLLIAAAAVICYWNTREYEFVRWDDTGYVIGNPLVTGDGGLKSIWLDVFRDKPVKLYYPLVWTSYWIEYQFFRDSPAGYHIVQMVLHALASVAVFLAIVSLGAPLLAAATAGLLFAVHPINVASVAWIAERKNTLSAIFFWGSLLAYVQFRRSGGIWRYIAAILAFQFSLFAKTACVVLAPILLVTDRLLDGKWTARAIARTAPFFGLALTMGLLTASAESQNRKSGEPLEWLLRPFVAAASLVHYIVKTIVPLDLVPVYQRWPASLSEPRYWITSAGVAVACGLVWKFRRRLAPLAWWSIAVFLLALGPALGLIQFNFLQFSFVSDHFVYFGLPGLLLIAGLLLEYAAGTTASPGTDSSHPTWLQSPGIRRRAAWMMLFTIAAILGWLTIRQNRIWKDPESFWTYTLDHNPDCVAGAFNLGNHYYQKNDYEAAMPRYAQAAKIDPEMIIYQRACARCSRQLGRVDEAITYYARTIENHTKKNSRGINDRIEFANYLLALNRVADAQREFEAVLRIQPNNQAAAQGLDQARSRQR